MSDACLVDGDFCHLTLTRRKELDSRKWLNIIARWLNLALTWLLYHMPILYRLSPEPRRNLERAAVKRKAAASLAAGKASNASRRSFARAGALLGSVFSKHTSTPTSSAKQPPLPDSGTSDPASDLKLDPKSKVVTSPSWLRRPSMTFMALRPAWGLGLGKSGGGVSSSGHSRPHISAREGQQGMVAGSMAAAVAVEVAGPDDVHQILLVGDGETQDGSRVVEGSAVAVAQPVVVKR